MSRKPGAVHDDHKYLIHLVHEFSGMAEDGRGVFLTDTVFSALLEYARVHFAREETAMAIGGYAFIDRHREDHKRLVETVVRIRDEFVMSPEGRARDRILALMQRWLVEHVMGADLDFRDAVRGHEAEIAAKLREMNMPVNWAKAGA